MLFDVARRYPRAYIHRHKMHTRPAGFGAEGQYEMYNILNQVDCMVSSTAQSYVTFRTPSNKIERYPIPKIYPTHPHIVADNHFSGDNVLNHAGRMGCGLTMTTRRDRFSSGLKEYLHHEKLAGTAVLQRAKVARYEPPIVAIKQVEALPPTDDGTATKAYTQTIVSFQSTGATNISGVNNLPSCQLYVTTKSRGSGDEKRVWGIEQNEGRQTYLSLYYGVDNVDHMIKLAKIKYITWKYWHSPYMHGLSIAVVAAYDMYLECAEGELDPEWYVHPKERMSFKKFRKELSKQMLMYNPKDESLLGDGNFRVVTQLPKARRGRNTGKRKAPPPQYADDGVSIQNLKIAKNHCKTRLCGNLDLLQLHVDSVEQGHNTKPCEACGIGTRWRCGMCKMHICLYTKSDASEEKDGKPKRKWTGTCLMKLHNDSFFGLTRGDHEDLEKKGRGSTKKVAWQPPSDTRIRRNTKHIKTLAGIIQMECDEDEE